MPDMLRGRINGLIAGKTSERMRITLGALSILAVLTAGCTTTLSTRAAMIEEVEIFDDSLSQCKYLGEVTGRSPYDKGDLFEETGWQNATSDAKNKAAEMGATHIIESGNTESRQLIINFKAYRCE